MKQLLLGINALYQHLLRHLVRLFIILFFLMTSLRADQFLAQDREAGLNQILAGRQFDFGAWLAAAWTDKLGHELLPTQHGLSDTDQLQFVRDYMQKVQRFYQIESRIVQIFTDPATPDPQTATTALRQERDALRAQIKARQNLAEAIFQEQVESLLREEGFALGGQVLPPLRFRFTELPDVLVISRRDKIERIDQRELTTGLTVDTFDQIERTVDQRFNVSSIVEPIGGLGSYPTMLGESSNIAWVVETIAHEWTHNYLLPAYVGRNYTTQSVARTINETTASIVGRELRQRVLQRFYPDLVNSEAVDRWDSGTVNMELRSVFTVPLSHRLTASLSTDWSAPNTDFDFNNEMRQTRVTTDDLLAQGKIEEAETYMEERRKLFVQNGYAIRKLNQAYFAFHGAYNAVPGGAPAAGRDRVGPAVQDLRKRSQTLGDFVRTIAQVTSLEDVVAAQR
jgi:hypothetical protein